jgi:hypothetical protein
LSDVPLPAVVNGGAGEPTFSIAAVHCVLFGHPFTADTRMPIRNSPNNATESSNNDNAHLATSDGRDERVVLALAYRVVMSDAP